MRKITHSSSGYEAFQETYRNSMESVKKLIAKYEEAAIRAPMKAEFEELIKRGVSPEEAFEFVTEGF